MQLEQLCPRIPGLSHSSNEQVVHRRGEAIIVMLRAAITGIDEGEGAYEKRREGDLVDCAKQVSVLCFRSNDIGRSNPRPATYTEDYNQRTIQSHGQGKATVSFYNKFT